MAVIVRATREKNGIINNASSVNRAIDDLYTLYNGGLDLTNITASWVVVLGDSAIDSEQFADESVVWSKVDASQLNGFIIAMTRLF